MDLELWVARRSCWASDAQQLRGLGCSAAAKAPLPPRPRPSVHVHWGRRRPNFRVPALGHLLPYISGLAFWNRPTLKEQVGCSQPSENTLKNSKKNRRANGLIRFF